MNESVRKVGVVVSEMSNALQLQGETALLLRNKRGALCLEITGPRHVNAGQTPRSFPPDAAARDHAALQTGLARCGVVQ